MKKSLLILLMPFLILAGCKKDDPKCPDVVASVPASEMNTLRTYIQANSIVAVEDSRGFFYRIEAAGSGTPPTPCSDITVDYVGRLTTGGIFDNGTNTTFNLGRLINGWKLGIPLIATGGRIVLYLPPSLGYGANNNGTIPGNSILIFTVDLKAIL